MQPSTVSPADYLPFERASEERHEHIDGLIFALSRGGPCRFTRVTKSLSLLMTVAPASRAARKISRSFASRRPRSRTATAATPRLSVSQRANWGES